MDKIFTLTGDKDTIREIKQTKHCYIVSKNGIFYKDDQPYIESMVNVSSIPTLKKVSPYIKWKYPKINAKQISSILKFFQDVSKEYNTECMIMIGWDRKKKSIVIFPPISQKVSSVSIHYENTLTPGIAVIGTIHSHNTMSAFHSGVDIHDEINFDGLHITIGNVKSNNRSFDISCELTSGKFRHKVVYNDVIDGIETKQVSSPVEPLPLFIQPYFPPSTDEPKKSVLNFKNVNLPTFDVSKNMQLTINKWITTVEKPSYNNFSRYGYGIKDSHMRGNISKSTKFTPLSYNNNTNFNMMAEMYDDEMMDALDMTSLQQSEDVSNLYENMSEDELKILQTSSNKYIKTLLYWLEQSTLEQANLEILEDELEEVDMKTIEKLKQDDFLIGGMW